MSLERISKALQEAVQERILAFSSLYLSQGWYFTTHNVESASIKKDVSIRRKVNAARKSAQEAGSDHTHTETLDQSESEF